MRFAFVKLRFSTSLWRKLDNWRREQEEIPSRAEAIRRLAELGLIEESKPKSER